MRFNLYDIKSEVTFFTFWTVSLLYFFIIFEFSFRAKSWPYYAHKIEKEHV